MSLAPCCSTESTFTKVQLHPDFKNGHVLQWATDPAVSLAGNYNFTVEKSELGNFSIVDESVDVGQSFFYRDSNCIKQNLSKDLYYRVKLSSENGVEYTPAVLFGTQPEDRRKWRMASEIVRKETLRIRKYAGNDGWLLKRMHKGIVNPKYVDPITGTSVDDEETYGTGFEQGYHQPLDVFWSVESSERQKSQEKEGLTETQVFVFRTVGFPFIEYADIIVDRNNRRYFVRNVSDTNFPSTDLTIIQSLQVSEILPSDNLYKIEIPEIVV